ncbi:Zn-dependent hydrolase [Jeotgalibacillus soli]|uniref:Hydantoinase n=1 Tax=Jeotgalibacillus soli TaxID=889306 RepID=A0A0C2RRA3_9BACL|nr:Zn-dependent hydrolase [Jeotgalibacillus soli]KIL44289.1 hydantoinase [Jeotgalibacillus soli]
MKVNQDRIKKRMEALAQIGKFGETGVNRVAFTEKHKESVLLVQEWMNQLGLTTKIDHFGNLIGRLEGSSIDKPVVMVGSHLDSQPNGGRFDGTIGVVGALEVVECMIENQVSTDTPIEVIAFSDEEGCRFNNGLFGSRGLTGKVTEEEWESKDRDGVTKREALRLFGCDPDKAEDSVYPPDKIACFIEMHIEQGPVLEKQDASIGVVEGIAGPLWATVEIIGEAGHAGSVPMAMRKDSLLFASYAMSEFNQIVSSYVGSPLVGTVGNIDVYPNSRNVIPEKVRFTIDLRDIDLKRRNEAFEKFEFALSRLADEFQFAYKIEMDSDLEPKLCSDKLIDLLVEEGKEINPSVPTLMSGPFHDALIMADFCNTGMIFVRSKDGKSHTPEEYSRMEDITEGAQLLLQVTNQLCAAKTEQV